MGKNKVTLSLDNAQVKVLAAALSVLPLFVDGKTFEKMVEAQTDDDSKLLMCMVGATLAGADNMKQLDKEMSMEALHDNMTRARDLLVELRKGLERTERKQPHDS